MQSSGKCIPKRPSSVTLHYEDEGELHIDLSDERIQAVIFDLKPLKDLEKQCEKKGEGLGTWKPKEKPELPPPEQIGGGKVKKVLASTSSEGAEEEQAPPGCCIVDGVLVCWD